VQAANSAPAACEGVLLSKPLVSVIDDDASLCAALVGLVRSLGYEARGFGSAEDFLRAAETCTFSCVISDVQMPGMSGIELKRHLTARDWRVPVIMITGRADSELERSAQESGAMCLLTKPFETSVLIRCVEQALELRKDSGNNETAWWD
jgi:FixJ family two-component response regulator